MKREEMMKKEKRDISVPVEKMCKRGFFTILPIVILLIGSYYYVHGWYDWGVQPWTDYFIVMGTFLLGFAIHEFIHALGWVINSEGKWKSIEYGYDINYLKPYVHPTEGIKISKFRIIKILPLILTGIIPYAIGMAIGSFHLTMASVGLIGLCGVDIVTIFLLRKEKGNNYILSNDNPSRFLGWIIEDK